MALLIKPFPEKTYRKLVESAFYTFTGIFIGIAMNDIWRLFDLPGNKQPSNYADISKDELYQYAISAGLSLTAFLFPFEGRHSNNALLGIGAVLGTRMSNTSERGSINLLPNPMKDAVQPDKGEPIKLR